MLEFDIKMVANILKCPDTFYFFLSIFEKFTDK